MVGSLVMFAKTILKYWKPIAVFWALILATMALTETKWKLHDSDSSLYWSNSKGEMYVAKEGKWHFVSLKQRKPKRKALDFSKLPNQRRVGKNSNLSFLPDQ